MTAPEKAAFIAGYEKGKTDSIDRCMIERISKEEPDWRTYNLALISAVLAIRALDVRHAVPR